VRRRGILAALGIGSAALALPGRAAPPVQDHDGAAFDRIPKILWVWRTPLGELPQVAEVMARRGFRAALVSVPADERQRADAIRRAVADFRARGLAFFLVGGDPAWLADRGEAVPQGLAQLLRLAEEAGPFDGLALDVEPHSAPQWKDESQRANLARAWVSVLGKAKAGTRRLGVELWAAIHPSQARTPGPGGGSMLLAGLREIDVAVTMAYRNQPQAAIGLAGPMMEDLARARRSWWFGVTTQDGPDAATISYYGLPPQRFRAETVEIDAALRAGPAGAGFRGIAVQHFATARALLS